MKNKVLSIITSMTMVVMSLPDIGAMNYGDKGMSKSAIVKTVGGIAAGVAGAGLIAYGMMKGWNYYQELVANEVCKKIKNEQDNTSNGSIKLDADEFHKKICKYYYAVCAGLMYGHLSSFVGKLSDTDVIRLVESKLKCYCNYNIEDNKDNAELVAPSRKPSTEESGSMINVEVITIPKSSECIGKEAFYNCTNLRSVTIPESIKTIGIYAFIGCPITNVNDGKYHSIEEFLDAIKIKDKV